MCVSSSSSSAPAHPLEQKAGRELKDAVQGNMEAMQSGLSIEQLTEGFMTQGESLTTFMVGYETVYIWPHGEPMPEKPKYHAGRWPPLHIAFCANRPAHIQRG